MIVLSLRYVAVNNEEIRRKTEEVSAGINASMLVDSEYLILSQAAITFENDFDFKNGVCS